MAVDIGPKIGIDGETEFRRNLNNINQQMKTLGSEMKAVTSAFLAGDDAEKNLADQTRILNQQIDTQEQKLEELRKGLDQAAEKFGEADTKTLRWKQAVNDATAQLNDLRAQLQKTEDGMGDFSEAAEDSSDALGGLSGGNLRGFVDQLNSLKGGLGGGAVVEGFKELAGAVLEIEESTREYRSIMGTLEVSSQAAGYSAEQTAETYGRLQAVLGDTQTAATATANLQAIGLSQEDLMSITDAAIGAWATYGDSIPIDGLAEAINETVQAGEVTGTFADVLNWAGESEDAFNEKLAAANTTADRANLVMEALAQQGLTEAADAWFQINEDIVKANESQAKMDEAMGKLGETLAPVADFLRNTMAGAISGVADALESAFEWAEKAWDALSDFLQLDKQNEVRAHMEDYYANSPYYNGSHASGLDYVPFDGYLAQLHRGEMVLTAAQANAIRAGANPGNDYSGLTAGIVNAMATLQSGGGVSSIEGVITLRTEDGTNLGRYLVPFVRREDQSNPEVVSDPL